MTRRFLLWLMCLTLAAPALAQVSPPVLKVEDGGTGANTAPAARANLGAAAAGANSDITSLSGLTTPLPASEGGTGSANGVSPTGALTTTPETVIDVADFGGCSGSPTADTANLNAALAAARTSSAYVNNQPVRVVGGYSTTGVACAVTQVNATGFTRFGGGGRLLIEDLALNCSGSGNICLDALGSLNIQFNKIMIVGSASNPPMIGFQEGNVSPATVACCIHTHYGLEITGSFTFAGLYSAASESTTYYSPIIRNNGASLGAIGGLGAVVGGSGYVNGAYNNVSLSGSATGAGALANVVVSGGAVVSVTLTNQGKQYAIGDSLTAPASALGGSGAGFSAPVANIAQFAMVMDGQNHWGAASSFQTVTWPADTYYTFSENNIIGGSLRYTPSGYAGAPLWMGSVEGLRTVHLYIAQAASGPCVSMFDNNATNTLHNIAEVLEVECETANATYDVQLTGSNPTPNISGFTLLDQLSTVNTALLGVDAGISSVTAHGSSVTLGHAAFNVPLFKIGAAGLWNFDGSVNLQYPWQFNAPASPLVTGASGGAPLATAGPLDFLSPATGTSAAYSCARRLSSTYNGPLCNIRRASDSSAVDFYANASGVIDKSALSAFCAGTSCFIAIEYDQSGNGNVARNTTTTTQPAVTIETALNYAVCGTWGNGGNVNLSVAANSSINGLFSTGGFLSAVSNKTATITNAMRLLSKGSGSIGWEFSGAFTAGYNYPQFTQYAGGVTGAWVSSTAMTSGGHVFDLAYSSSTSSNVPTLSIDGTTMTFQSTAQPTGAISDTANLVIGNSAAGGFGWPGDICETIFVKQTPSPAQLDAIRRGQAVFYGMPSVL